MGMSDKQFEAYQKAILRRLETAEREIEERKEPEELRRIIQDLKDELQRP